ncbi:hypothetical protein O6H91_23G065000 [Diphasiastrum complanatum]|uniref:Uncharacterized protein n=1 Tax=Diphasiastrum complanatum TaxID=34168 RepID=A0ACC2ABL8_DIPCM|nr:hypothetical protein O6H91_23G065000 [Diphasiastrum complanatum]
MSAGVGGKAYNEAAKIKIKRNAILILAAKFENKQLRAAFKSLRERETCAFGRSDFEKMTDKVASLRKLSDEQRELNISKQLLFEKLLTDTRSTEMDFKALQDMKTSPLVRLRTLESMLDKATEKLKNTRLLAKNYESISKPMTDARTLYDSQMKTLERTLQRRDHELEQMMLMYYDSLRAREASRAKLEDVALE